MVERNTIDSFLTVLSSKSPTPGGGGASALAGALGNALGQMVASLTTGKKRYAQFEGELAGLVKQMEELGREFIRLADADEEVFAPLAKAYGLPCGTEEEKKQKETIMEERLLAASLVPLEMMEKALELLGVLKVLGEKGSRLAVSDVGVGVQFARACLLGAVMNVYINTKSMKNRERAGELNGRAQGLVEAGTALADEVYGRVLLAVKA